MGNWKLVRQGVEDEEYLLEEGENTIGRGLGNTIHLTSVVVSRRHSVIAVDGDTVKIKDLQSSNGTYVGSSKISQNIYVTINNTNIIGIGWAEGASKINDFDKYVFELKQLIDRAGRVIPSKEILNNLRETQKEVHCKVNGIPVLESSINLIDSDNDLILKPFESKSNLKRKLRLKSIEEKPPSNHIIYEEASLSQRYSNDIIALVSDSDDSLFDVNYVNQETPAKKPKLDVILEEKPAPVIKEELELDYDVFNVKQECQYSDEEPIQVDSDSESETWYLRLSQSSPGKSFSKNNSIIEPELSNDVASKNASTLQEDKSCKDNSFAEDEEYLDDLILIPSEPITAHAFVSDGDFTLGEHDSNAENKVDETDSPFAVEAKLSSTCAKISREKTNLMAVMIEPVAQKSRRSSVPAKEKTSKKKQSIKSSSSPVQSISLEINKTSQKEERRKRLKEIATKEKNEKLMHSSSNSAIANNQKVNVKVTKSSRGAFLTEETTVTKPVKKNHHSKKEKLNCLKEDNRDSMSKNLPNSSNHKQQKIHSQNIAKKNKEIKSTVADDSKEITNSELLKTIPENAEPVTSLKPKKSVTFSSSPPEIHLFEIEPGNQLKKTSSVKTTILDARRMPVFSLEKIFLMRILRWNPQWLNEQVGNSDPPPILGHANPPLALIHSFRSHNQYVQVLSDLIIMEIWEYLTQSFMRKRNEENLLQMRLESLPLVPSPERCLEVFSLNVNISLPKNDSRKVPRVGELMLINFGPENAKVNRFFYVTNVRILPSPQNNVHNFYSVSLYATYTDKMKNLQTGELMLGRTLSYIKNELALINAIEYLAGSPLHEAILKPELHHFRKGDGELSISTNSQWTNTLNSSQLQAVNCSVAAALSDTPSIQMIQGPPGTGKSSVICSIIMSYFYDTNIKRQPSRGKILICATSNAAVDELVLRLLKIRQSLPYNERFRMVRVGRDESMHSRARDVSSHTLALRDAQKQMHECNNQPILKEEISYLEGKINMWRTSAQDAQNKEPGRVAFCQNRITQLTQRLNQLKSTGLASTSGDPKPDRIAAAERRIIECADIIVTTLSSAAHHKMRGLKRRIALCIVDEAGQAIEPETLIPLMLDVTRLTLIGDPQQLPGYICSQRAKQHGLGESMFSRLSSYTEQWDKSPVILLDVQYRMHPAIADYPNRVFYGNKVRNSSTIRKDFTFPSYMLVFISSGDRGQNVAGANDMEAWAVSRIVLALNKLAQQYKMNLAVITPYNAHKDLIRKNIRLIGAKDSSIEVNTVDSFQGQERDIVVVSLARSQGVGFLTDTGRMNVMLTRAKHCLLICLNPQALVQNNQWRTLIEDAQRRNMYKHLPTIACQPITAEQLISDDILKYINIT